MGHDPRRAGGRTPSDRLREPVALMRSLRSSGLKAAALTLPLAACSSTSVLSPAGPVADANRSILLNALTIMLAIVVPTILATLAFAWWFRASNPRAQYRPDFVYSGRIEMIVWSIPIL